MNALPLLLALSVGEVRLGLGRYAVDPSASSIGFDGTSTLHDFTAKAGRFGGEARVDPSALSDLAGAVVWIETDSLDSGSSGRDGDMKELLESARHPWITFALRGAEGALDRWKGALKLYGTFSIRGVARERLAWARIEPRADGFRAVGEVRFQMSEHGIKPPRKLILKTGDEVRVWFDLAFRKVPSRERPADVRTIGIREVVEGRDGKKKERARTSRLWTCGDRLLWEREGTWIVGSPAGTDGVAAGPAESLDLPPPAEDAFRPYRERAAALGASTGAPPAGEPRAGPSGRETREELERILRAVPDPATASLLREGKTVRIRFGEEDWLVLEDLEGEERFSPLLAGFAGAPRPVRDALADLRGLPARAELRTVQPAERRRILLSIGPPAVSVLPEWAVDPATWTKPSGGGLAW